MSVSLRGKNAIVTGAAVGIGPAYAEALAAEGVNVAVCDIRQEILELPARLEAHSVRSVGWVADVSVPEDVRKVVDGTVEALGGIDILISNAGKCWVSVADDDLDKTLVDYEGMVGTNLKGEYLMGRAVIAEMLKQGRGGEIVNVATDHSGGPSHRRRWWRQSGAGRRAGRARRRACARTSPTSRCSARLWTRRTGRRARRGRPTRALTASRQGASKCV